MAADGTTTRTGATRRTLLRAAPAWLAAGLAPWRTASAANADADNVARLLRGRLAEQGFGLVAVQVEGDEPTRVDAAGRDREGMPLADGASFEIGSLTKTFTALLLAEAVLRREVALDGAVEDVLPGVKLRDSAGAPIRWIDLATHRSGLPRLPPTFAPADPTDPYADLDEARLLADLRAIVPDVPRNTRWAYSNLGFGLLGYALGRAASQRYEEVLTTRVLKPLGLASATVAVPGRAIAALAEGHDAQGRAVPHWHFRDAMAGAGGLVMSGADVGRYLRAALAPERTPLGPAFALAMREHAAGPSAMNPIGLAWLRAPLNDRTVLNHDGATAGFSSSAWLDPARRRAAAVLSNAAVGVNDLALHLLDASVPPAARRTAAQTSTRSMPPPFASRT